MRERADGEQKPDGSPFFFSFIVLISFGLWEKLFLCLDCVLRFVAIEIKKREREWGKREMEERGKNNFLFNWVIILGDNNV